MLTTLREWIVDSLGTHGSQTVKQLSTEVYSAQGRKPTLQRLRSELSRLRKKGLIVHGEDGYFLTDEGHLEYAESIVGGDLDIYSAERFPEEREIARYRNRPRPGKCEVCEGLLEEGGGYVGETVLYCPEGHGIFWEDSEDAVRRIM